MVENPDYSQIHHVAVFVEYGVVRPAQVSGESKTFFLRYAFGGQTGRTHYALVPETPDSVLQDERFSSLLPRQALVLSGRRQKRYGFDMNVN